MRIIIDCFKQVKGVGKSIGIYNVALSLTKNLINEKNITSNDVIKNSEIYVLGNQYNKKDFDITGVNFIQIKKYNPLNKFHCIFWELFGVSKICKKLKGDKILFPRGYCALTHPIEDIVLIHDCIPFYYNEHFYGYFNKLENWYIMNRMKQSAKTSKKIITISESSKKDIIKYCNVKPKKISVIHNACNAVEFNERKIKPEKEYICAMTSNLPHKNARGIFESYSLYYKQNENPLDLVVIGVEDAKKYGVPSDVIRHIRCYKFLKNNDDMYRLINNSTMFLFLSLIEGFGLPPIEAMQLKTPTICSNDSSLPEVVGEAAMLVNPTDYKEIANSIEKLQNDKELRDKLVCKGLKNIERFSWKSRAKLYWKEIIK